MKIDVRFGAHQPPLMRQLISHKITTANGTGADKGRQIKWLHWYWQPEPRVGEENMRDCGFSGVSEDHDKFNKYKKRLEALQG